MVTNIFLVIAGVCLWVVVARDASAVERRTGQRIWSLSNRTWAWIVAVTFVGLVPYAVGRTLTTRPPPTPPE